MSDGKRVDDLLQRLSDRERELEGVTNHVRRLQDEVTLLRRQLFDAQAALASAQEADTIPAPNAELPLPKYSRVARAGRALAAIHDAHQIALELANVQMATALRSAELYVKNYIEALQ